VNLKTAQALGLDLLGVPFVSRSSNELRPCADGGDGNIAAP
jgi:hypothetical protein